MRPVGWIGTFLLSLMIGAVVQASEPYEVAKARETKSLTEVMRACKTDAQKACVDKFIEACSERGKWTTVAMILCNGVAHDHWDRELNRIYKKVMARAQGKFRTAIRDAQRNWVAYRDSRCGTYQHFDGTMWRPVAVSCLVETTQLRLQDLLEILDAGPLQPAATISEDVYGWRTERSLVMDLNCDGDPDRVLFGLSGDSQSPMGAIGWIDGAKRGEAPQLVVSVPIGGITQYALCGIDVSLEVVDRKPAICPVLRVDDGRCDALYIWRDKASSNWMLDRN